LEGIRKENKILFIEPARHYEVVRSYINMFYFFGFKADLMTTSFNVDKLNNKIPDDVSIISLEENISIQQQLIDHTHTIDQYPTVIVTTEEDIACTPISKVWKSKTCLLIHHINTAFFHRENLAIDDISDLMRWIKYRLENRYNRLSESILTYDGYILPVVPEIKLFEKIFNKKQFYLPFLFNEYTSNPENDIFKIVIPGSTSSNSRDYSLILTALESLRKTKNQSIELILLGINDGDKKNSIIQKIKNFESEFLEIITYDAEVSQAEFDKVMIEANVLLLPLRIETKHHLIRSIGGEYQLSGNIGDMVRYGKKAFITDGYKLPFFLEKHTLRFDKNNLADKIIHYINYDHFKSKNTEPYITEEEIQAIKKEVFKIIAH
jgi:hypothetical protein